MRILEEGRARIISKINPEEHRRWVLKKKTRALKDKVTSIEDAVARYVHDGSYIFLGFFGSPVSMVTVYEIIRQNKRKLDIGRGGVFELDILAAAGLVKRVDRGYAGFEVRGLAPAFRTAVERGVIEVYEWSNSAFAWRLKAGAMGLSFLPTRVMMGTDTLKHSAAKVIGCPYTGLKMCIVPACYPDLSVIHAHRCDKYGNAQLDRVSVMDIDAAKASRRVIITTEKIVPTARLRREPWRTVIPHFYVDAVVEVPWGAHPSNMPSLYYMDEEFLAEWLRAVKTSNGAKEFLNRYIYNVSGFEEYLELIGGSEKLEFLRRLELLREPLRTPWKKG